MIDILFFWPRGQAQFFEVLFLLSRENGVSAVVKPSFTSKTLKHQAGQRKPLGLGALVAGLLSTHH
jgi:hypothetical protein